VPPIRNQQGEWVYKSEEKAETFAKYLETVFKPHDDIQSRINTNPTYKPNKKIKKITSLEIANEIDNNINIKKAPGVDNIPPRKNYHRKQ